MMREEVGLLYPSLSRARELEITTFTQTDTQAKMITVVLRPFFIFCH